MDAKGEFERAGRERPPGVVGEFLHFLGRSKKWWLIPILCVLAVLAALCFFASSAAAPFIYTLF